MNSFRIGAAHVEVWRGLSELTARAAELLTRVAQECVTKEGAFKLALSGGSTPKALYERLAGPDYRERIPWTETLIFWSDERCVAPDDPHSNYRMAHEALLSHVHVPAKQIYRLRGEDDPASAAASYASILKEQLDAPEPRFSLILLGMGDDAHTASLFPHSEALQSIELVAAPYVEKLKAHRLTLTLRTINAAANVIFLVSGEAKAAALKRVFEDEDASDALAYPARLVRPHHGELLWLVDEAAAKLLSL
jgi:6-phosphogluconolactonase